MSSPHNHSSSDSGGDVRSAEEGSLLGTLIGLWPFIWPHDRSDLKARVGIAMVLLVIVTIVSNILIHFQRKEATK